MRLIQHPVAIIFTGLLTLPLAALVGGSVIATLLHSTVWAVAAALVLPIALLLYARCWGRFAWLVLNARAGRRSPEKAPPPEAERTAVLDPWALPPPEEIPEMDVEVDEPEPPPPPADEDEEWAKNPAPYAVPGADDHAAPPTPFSHEEYYDEYRKREEERKARAEGRKPGVKRRRRRATFANAFGADFWPFLVEQRTLRAGLGLGVLTLAFLVLVRIAVLMMPGR